MLTPVNQLTRFEELGEHTSPVQLQLVLEEELLCSLCPTVPKNVAIYLKPLCIQSMYVCINIYKRMYFFSIIYYILLHIILLHINKTIYYLFIYYIF